MSDTPQSRLDYLVRFVPEAHFHVYNRTNNREPLFQDDADRNFFLKQYKRFVSEYVDTYTYCLLTNHFHLALRIKPAATLLALAEQTPEKKRTSPQKQILQQPEEERDFHPLVERQFTRMFTAYSTNFNRRHERSGNLFHRPFKRVAVEDESHLQWLVYYIHHNPRKHGLMEDFLHYPWSSYLSLVSEKPTALLREAVWEMFGSKEHFIAFHEGREPQQPKGWNLGIED